MKYLLFFVLIVFTLTANAQSSSKKKLLVGTWSVMTVSYGDYYSYDMEKDKIEVREKLQKLMLQDSARYGNEFLEALRKKASEYARSSSFAINQDGTYSLSMGTSKYSGKFEYLPLRIPISDKTPESDTNYNEAHQDDMAYLELSNGESVSITEYADALVVYHYNKAKQAADESFYAKVVFYKKK